MFNLVKRYRQQKEKLDSIKQDIEVGNNDALYFEKLIDEFKEEKNTEERDLSKIRKSLSRARASYKRDLAKTQEIVSRRDTLIEHIDIGERQLAEVKKQIAMLGAVAESEEKDYQESIKQFSITLSNLKNDIKVACKRLRKKNQLVDEAEAKAQQILAKARQSAKKPRVTIDEISSVH